MRRDHRAIDVGLRKVLPGVGIVDGKRQIRRSAFPEVRLIRWARGRSTFTRATRTRIHGTNQPEQIGQAISSGCIRMTNEDIIDLVNRVKLGAIVVLLPPGRSAWMGPIAGSRS